MKSVVFAACAATSVITAALAGSCTTSKTYDYFMLVEQWAITECEDVFSCKASNHYFTLHGLWPNDNNGDYPCTCTNEKFDPSAVSSIKDELSKYWLSLNGPDDTFWEHEYTKHGTCAEDVFPSQLDFFNGTLTLLHQFDAVDALATAGIYPSNTKGFSLATFRKATAQAYGNYPVVTCDSKGRIEGITYCVGKDLSLMACPSSTSDSCSASTLYLPASMAMDKPSLRGNTA